MTALETLEQTDWRNVKLKERDKVKIGDSSEFVTNIFYEGDRLVRFWSARRNEKGIIESRYNIDRRTGELQQLYFGEFYGQETIITKKFWKNDGHSTYFTAQPSQRYSELNEFLESCGNST